MITRSTPMPRRLATATAATVFALSLAACGGGSGEAPPQQPGSTVEAAAPVLTITNNIGAETATGDIVFTFSFNRDVGTSFTADDVVVTGGSKGAFTRVSGTSATLVVTPDANSSGTVQVSVAAGTVTDATGTANAAVSASKAYNTVAPVVRTALVTFEESPAPTLIGFGGAEDATVVVDPTNAGNKVARIVKSATAELWAGTTVAVCPSDAIARLPFSTTLKKMSARVWSPVAGIPVRLKVENAADPTQSVETEATVTVASGWQTLTFDFANPAAGTAALNPALTYNKASVFFNFGTTGTATGARTYYLDDLSFEGSSFTASCNAGSGGGGGGGGGSGTVTITMDEATPPTLTGFGGAEDATIVTDPAGGTNKVVRVVKSATAELWAGTTISTGAGDTITRIAFASGSTTITARVWSPVAGIPVRMKVETAGDPTKSVETEATVTTASGWQTLSFNFANQAAGTAALNLATTYNRLSVFFNFGTTGAATGARTYYIDDISYPGAAASGGGSSGGTLVFASGYTSTNGTAQGGSWGYFSGDFSNYANTYTGGGFADSTPPLADDAQYFYIAVTTSAPTAPTGTPPTSGGYLGMYVTHPGLALSGQTQLAVNLGMDANFFQQASNKNIDVFVVGSTTYSNGSGGNCNVTLKGSITPTTAAMVTYTLPLSGMTLVQPCNGGGFSSGVSTVAQALGQPIGAVNTQFTFPNVNTTVNSGSGGAPVYATGITRGKTEFR